MKDDTRIGVGAVGPAQAAIDDEDDGRPTGKIERPTREPVRVISMKAPEPSAPEKAAPRKPEVKLAPPPVTARPVSPQGRLAPPRNTREVRVRRVRDVVLRASVAVIVASVVALVIWLIAGR